MPDEQQVHEPLDGAAAGLAVADRDGPEEGSFIVDEATDEVLRLHLDSFEGPFEVLLYLIKSQEIDIFDIPIVKITQQYLKFLGMMREENLDVTGEFLVMAATLIQIKSRMLLPPDTAGEEEEELEEEDPRLELVEKLLEYRKFRHVMEFMEKLAEARDQWFTRNAKPKIEEPTNEEEELLEVTLYDLTEAFRGVLRFFNEDVFHTVNTEEHSVDQKIEHIQEWLARDGSVAWTDLFRECGSRIELVCCFLAILELCRMGRMRANQQHAYGEIRLFPIQEDALG